MPQSMNVRRFVLVGGPRSGLSTAMEAVKNRLEGIGAVCPLTQTVFNFQFLPGVRMEPFIADHAALVEQSMKNFFFGQLAQEQAAEQIADLSGQTVVVYEMGALSFATLLGPFPDDDLSQFENPNKHMEHMRQLLGIKRDEFLSYLGRYDHVICLDSLAAEHPEEYAAFAWKNVTAVPTRWARKMALNLPSLWAEWAELATKKCGGRHTFVKIPWCDTVDEKIAAVLKQVDRRI